MPLPSFDHAGDFVGEADSHPRRRPRDQPEGALEELGRLRVLGVVEAIALQPLDSAEARYAGSGGDPRG
jgi:hypothetical protein